MAHPTLTTEAFSLAFRHFAEGSGVGKDRRVLLMLDWAGWHIDKAAEVPEGIEFGLLPTRPSPSLRSVCGRWSKRGQPNRPFEGFDELGEALVEHCLTLLEEHELARSHTRSSGVRTRREQTSEFDRIPLQKTEMSERLRGGPMSLTGIRQTTRRRNAPTPNAPSPGLYKILTAFYERTRTKLVVQRLSQRVGRRCYTAPAGKRYERNAADVNSALISVLHSHDGTARDHAERTRLLAERVALELELDLRIVRTTGWAATLHDIGKICVPRRILNKPGKLDEGEWRVLRRHSETGADILSKIGISERISSAVLAHHERYDGRGYPAGLAGEDIPIEARIISVVDAYDVMTTSDRPYGKAMKAKEALEEIERNAGTQFCPVVVRAFLGGVGRARLPCRGYTRSATGPPKSLT